MHPKLKGVRAVGFDIDGTLYPATPEIDNRVRTQIALRLLDKKPELKDVDSARIYFEQKYSEIQSGTRVLREAGYKNASGVMDYCLANADVLDLIQPNYILSEILLKMNKRYELNLLTSSPEELSLSKLERLGINSDLFYQKLFSASKSDGIDFHTLVHFSEFPAHEHVYIGDRLKSDIIPAKKLGMKTITVWSEIPESDISINHINKIGELLL